MNEAIDLIVSCIDRREQGRQLSFMAQTQGQEFAQAVHDKVKSKGGLKKS